MSSKNKINNVIKSLINIRYFYTIVSTDASEYLKKNHINCGEALYLVLLSQYIEGLTMSELSLLVKVDKSLTTRTVKKLLIKKYIYKDTDKINSRKYKIKLTADGILKAEEVNKILITKHDMFVKKFSDEELNLIESTFNLIIDRCDSNI